MKKILLLVPEKKYIKSNILATFNLLETFKSEKLVHFMVASTSSVYGLNKKKIYDRINYWW